MTTERRDPGGVPAHIRKLLRDQQAANEKLILVTIHAHELKDEAERAAHLAQEASKKAEVAKEIAQALAENLEKRARELVATAEFREQLLAIVGHDLRNPLQAISMSAYLLAEHGSLNELDAKLVARIRNSAQRMGRMIAQLVEFTRARLGGGLALDLKPTDFREVCRQVIEELEVGSRAQVHSDARGELLGTWDADRLAQVLSNIVGNAVDHAAPGTTVLITASEDDTDIFVEITNQGAPIPTEVLPIIFQPFRGGRHGEHAKVGHLGLGLFIAHQVILAHGGEIAARSADGATTFSIRLPRHAELHHAP